MAPVVSVLESLIAFSNDILYLKIYFTVRDFRVCHGVKEIFALLAFHGV
jgi:hypothetical protein